MNREDWLTEMGKRLEVFFKGMRLDPYRVTCGWPSVGGTGHKARRVGECHGAESSKAKVYEIFISPVLENSLEVGGTLCHELAHVAAGIGAKHGPEFASVCKHVGLTKGKWTSVMPGVRLNDSIRRVVNSLGEYPHRAIVGVLKEKKPRTTVGLECGECGCKVTISLKWLEESGSPVCGCGGVMRAEGEDGDA
jgi:hypothetical protein